nr:hypothetical protein [Tanacetum cinerariifolium]
MRTTNPLQDLERVFIPLFGPALMGLNGVHLGLGPSYGPIRFLRAKTNFYGVTDTFHVSNKYAGQVVYNHQGYNGWQNGGIQVAQNAVQNVGVQSGGNQNGLVVVPGITNQNGAGNVVFARADGTENGNQARCYNCRGLGIQLQAEEFDFMAAAGDLDEIEEVNANCILMENLQHVSTSGT